MAEEEERGDDANSGKFSSLGLSDSVDTEGVVGFPHFAR